MDARNQFSCSWGSIWCGFCRNLCQFWTVQVRRTLDILKIPALLVLLQFSILSFNYTKFFFTDTLYRRNQELIKELSTPTPGSKDLYFPTKYSQSFVTQCEACFWKQYWSYWRNPQYNAIRFFMTIVIGILFGLIFWSKGDKT